MRAFGHATILIASFDGLRQECLAPWLPLCDINTTKNGLKIMSLAAYASEANELLALPMFSPYKYYQK